MGSIIQRRTAQKDTRRASHGAAQSLVGIKRLVWRISAEAPLGEWVDPAAVPQLKQSSVEPAEVTTGGFLSSSFDLLRGTDIQEYPGDTVPSELYDEFFPELADEPKKK